MADKVNRRCGDCGREFLGSLKANFCPECRKKRFAQGGHVGKRKPTRIKLRDCPHNDAIQCRGGNCLICSYHPRNEGKLCWSGTDPEAIMT